MSSIIGIMARMGIAATNSNVSGLFGREEGARHEPLRSLVRRGPCIGAAFAMTSIAITGALVDPFNSTFADSQTATKTPGRDPGHADPV
ncbi:hypothetical protein [Mesorhizobium sp. B2-3-5]|uniref:hypothetical protein n=1 Tax=Mesorhizobium sp. B2-3-5 TaxID=2589958 RepID=UPI00112D9EA1|nr:hypothetical protein [Mesorhizobium sp. B2-3-5]TPM34374.1 hypothetical protein FJ958_08350 [Mesorhizobium sp. B2-3-5]